MGGAGATNILSDATLSISKGATKRWDNRTINNGGATTWSGGDVIVGRGAAFNNLPPGTGGPGGRFDVQGDGCFCGGTGGGTFNNAGSFVKSASPSGGTTSTRFDAGVRFNNAGFVQVQIGTFELLGSGTSTRPFETLLARSPSRPAPIR